MNLIIWLAFAAVTLSAIIFSGLREFHMLQLNGYKTPEHSWWMKKNFKRYILPIVLFIGQFALIAFPPLIRTKLATPSDMPSDHAFIIKYVISDTNKLVTAVIIGVLVAMNLFIAVSNKPGKKFKKPF
ncbi:MAG: UDP-N-acetylmuramoyl-tripeptide--D-alanyl-D-alanine ligase, partial [Ruminococcus sp.]|nr:UDP-N-acetylmuramoyl-tripeptide--D-alanyl-D-alanine ligase [Ruminococcus sp.]